MGESLSPSRREGQFCHATTWQPRLLVLEAIRTELRKVDRPINESDFDWRERVLNPGAKNGAVLIR